MAQTQTTAAAVDLTMPLLEDAMFRLAKGDKDALTVLYEQTKTSVYAYAMSMLHTPADAQDVLQNTYIRLYETAPRYVPMGKPLGWILTITRNLCLMTLREQKKQTGTDMHQWELAWEDNLQLTTEDKVVLQGALDALGQQERQVVLLHAVSGMKHREIADLLKLPLSTVLSKYSRGIKRLHGLLREEGI